MTRAPLIAAALLAAISARAADPAEPKMKASFIGEGGGYKHPDPATDQYMEGSLGAPGDSGAPAPAAKTPSATPLPQVLKAAPLPPQRPASPRIDAPSRSVSGRPPAAERNASIPGEARPAGRSSLWNGLVQPLDMKGSDVGTTDPAQAREGGDRDYETHILGMKAAPARPALGAPEAPSSPAFTAAAPSAARAESGKVFVSLEIDPREAGSLRDAVAGLGASTGFAADARFEALAGPGGNALISGWIPASRLGDALARPGIKRLSVETRARPSAPRRTSGEFVVGLRVDDAAHAREGVDAGVRALSAAAGFRLTRVVGLETAPDGRAVAVVAGTLPLSRLAQALSLSEVAKISPAGGEPPAPSADASPVARAPGLKGFIGFAAERGPWLIILTLLLALPSLREPARRLAAVFNPYR
ncbi:MAG: hypothetical protein KGJ84_06670 [Elusimicrobia bacterium]|nr:hypothetical protein [Elusimicrobiota bacterium]